MPSTSQHQQIHHAIAMRCMQAKHNSAASKTAMPLFNDDLMVVGRGRVLTVTFRPACRAFSSSCCASFSTLLNVLDCVSSCCLSSVRICSFCNKAFANASCRHTSSQGSRIGFRPTRGEHVVNSDCGLQVSTSTATQIDCGAMHPTFCTPNRKKGCQVGA